MIAIENSKKIFLVTFLVFISLHLYLMSTIRIFPFLDIPNHLAIATIYRFYGVPTNQFDQYYVLDVFPKPNVLHLFFCGSKIFPTVEFGNKIFYCLYVFLFPLATVLVIRKLEGNPWFALLSFLLLYNCNVCYGLTGFTIAIPFVLLVFYFLLDYLANRNKWTTWILMALFVILFFMHVLAALFALLVFFMCCLCQKNVSLIKAIKKTSVTIPLLTLIIIWWSHDTAAYSGQGLIDSLFEYYKNNYLKDLILRVGFLVHDNFRLYGGIVGYCIALFFSLLIIGLTVYGAFLHRKSLKHKIVLGPLSNLSIFALCSLTCVLLMPSRLPGYSFLFERFSVFLLLSTIFIGSIISVEKLYRITKLIICFACLAHFVLWADCFNDFEKENRSFTKNFFPSNADGKKMAGLIYDYRFRETSVYDNFPDYYIVWQQGITTTRFIDDRSFPVRRKTSKASLPSYIKWIGKYDSYDGRYQNMNYILVRGELPKRTKKFLENFIITKKEGKWVLYQVME